MKYIIRRYLQTVGTYSMIIAFLFSFIISFLIIYFTKLNSEKYYIVISPFATVFLSSVGYFIYKLDKAKPKILIKKSLLSVTEENANFFLEDFKNNEFKENAWIIKNNEINHFDYNYFVDGMECFYVIIENDSDSSDLILEIYMKNKKIKEIPDDLRRLYPKEKRALFLDRSSIIKIKYFNNEKYGRKDTHEF